MDYVKDIPRSWLILKYVEGSHPRWLPWRHLENYIMLFIFEIAWPISFIFGSVVTQTRVF